VRQVVCRFHPHAAAAALCVLSLLVAPAAHAATLFGVGPGGNETANVVLGHLPSWVQVASASASLYTSDSGTQPIGSTTLARYTFLRVLSGGATRLEVDAYDEYGSVSASGWVDPAQVLPSAPGTDWLVASTATNLWRSADASADAVTHLERFTPLQLVDGPGQDRIEVRIYRPDFSGVVDQGWVDASDTGPALAPQMRVPSPTERTLGLRTASTTNQQQAFLDAAADAARQSAFQTGVPASVTVAQAILESDWGRSQLSVTANNYFGIKALGSLGSDGVVWMPTSEYDSSGGLYQTVSPFRAYKSLADSMTDHDLLLADSSRYAPAMKVARDPRQFAVLLAAGGYSTDPMYADKIVALMDRYDLYRLDS
jgi:Mannosyl-glycoprotein endo-beta-N-acetylglucosaminidase